MDLLELQITNKCSLDKAQIAAAMNGNLVALCSLNENDAFPNCLGFGKNLIFIWTCSSSQNSNCFITFVGLIPKYL